jgi:hypothetical protein
MIEGARRLPSQRISIRVPWARFRLSGCVWDMLQLPARVPRLRGARQGANHFRPTISKRLEQ